MSCNIILAFAQLLPIKYSILPITAIKHYNNNIHEPLNHKKNSSVDNVKKRLEKKKKRVKERA